jgi:hypothetical protein
MMTHVILNKKILNIIKLKIKNLRINFLLKKKEERGRLRTTPGAIWDG